MSTTAEHLKRTIHESGKSLREIARESGVDVAAISRLMSGERSLSLAGAERVALALGYRLELVKGKQARGKR